MSPELIQAQCEISIMEARLKMELALDPKLSIVSFPTEPQAE